MKEFVQMLSPDKLTPFEKHSLVAEAIGSKHKNAGGLQNEQSLRICAFTEEPESIVF